MQQVIAEPAFGPRRLDSGVCALDLFVIWHPRGEPLSFLGHQVVTWLSHVTSDID